jgi:hypothetical protein
MLMFASLKRLAGPQVQATGDVAGVLNTSASPHVAFLGGACIRQDTQLPEAMALPETRHTAAGGHGCFAV